MQRSRFLVAVMAVLPLASLARMKYAISLPRTITGFRVAAGEARFGNKFLMKGITQNTLDLKISGKDTDGEIAVFEQTGLTPNGGPPMHTHTDQDEWFYVVEGKYKFKVGDELYELSGGDTIFLPRNIPHAFLQRSEKGRMIVTYMPAGKMEDFFRLTDSWTTQPDRESVARAFADHGMLVFGPPLNSE